LGGNAKKRDPIDNKIKAIAMKNLQSNFKFIEIWYKTIKLYSERQI
jgi:hypothetical protein